MLSPKINLLRNAGALSAVQAANLILPLVSVPIISRIIGPDKFGVVNYAANFMLYFSLLIEYGFNFTATRRLSRDPENEELRNRIFSEVLLAKSLLFLTSCILFFTSLSYLNILKKDPLVALFSFTVSLSFVLSQNWFFQAMQNLTKIALFNFLSKLAFTVLAITIIQKKSDYIWLPLITGTVSIFISSVSIYEAIRKYKLKLLWTPLGEILGLLWKEKTIFFSTIVISIYTTTNIVILGFFESETEVGYYTAAFRIIMVITGIINTPLAQSLYPFIGKNFGESKAEGLNIARKFLPLIVMILGFITITTFILSPFIIDIVFGQDFTPATKLLRILVFIPFVVGLNNLLGIQIMLNVQMDREFFFITLAGAIWGTIMNILLIHFMGSEGTAYNWLLTEVLITAAMYQLLKQRGYSTLDRKSFSLHAMKNSLMPVISKLIRKS